MNLWSRLFGGGVRASSATAPAIATFSVGSPVWTERRYDLLADESFVKNAIANRCIRMIAEAYASMPWLLMDGTNEIEQHDLLNLLARPAPGIGGQAFMEAVASYLIMEGNAYIEGVPTTLQAPGVPRIDNGKPPAELWTPRPDRMKVIPGARGQVQAFQYQVNGINTDWAVDQVSGRSLILHLKEFHPINDWYGLSRVQPAAYAIDQHNEVGKHNTALLQNGARPAGALAFDAVTVGGQVQNAPKDVIEAAEKRLADRHSGSANAGKPLVLGGSAKWLEMGMTPRDGDFNNMKLEAAREICTAFGVPHILLIPGASTFNNVSLARLQFYEETVLPLAGRICDALNAWLAPRYSGKLLLSHDMDEIPALEPRRETKRTAAAELFKSGLITRNEARVMLQFDELEGDIGDELAVPSRAGEESSGKAADETAAPPPAAPAATEPAQPASAA